MHIKRQKLIQPTQVDGPLIYPVGVHFTDRSVYELLSWV